MRKRKVLIIILISAAVFICAKQIDSELKYDLNIADYYRYSSVTMGQISDIIDQGSLQVGVTHYPPLAFVNKYSNNNNIGMMADCLHFLGIELGCDIFSVTGSQEYISDLFKDDSLNAVMVEKNDFTAGEYDFTQPLFTSRGRIMVRSASGIESLDDLKGQALVAVKSDDVLDSVNRNEDFMEKVNIIEVDNMYQCFALIRKNVVSGFIGSDLEAAYFVRSISAESSYQFIGPDFYEKEICLGVKKGDAELLKALNKGILDMKKQDFVYQTQQKWLGDYDRGARGTKQIELIYKILLAILLIIVAFSVWNYVITQRVNTKTRELFESKEELRSIIDTMKSGMIVIENGSDIVECNNAASIITGLPRDALIGHKCDDIEQVKPFIEESNENKIMNIGNSYYYITRQKFGENKSLLIIGDETNKYLVERRARQESKMIAVGQLSAGLAHEIRNPLGLIKSYSYVFQRYCIDETSNHAITVINDSVGRINKLVENLLRFSRLSNDENKLVDVAGIVADVMVLEESNIQHRSIVMTSSVKGGSQVCVNEDVLRLILLNLINNSIESFETITSDSKRIDINIVISEEKLKLVLSDNGCGIEKNDIEKIFNPFYSTKEKGTGLGLYLISTEIANNDGSINVDSSPEGGTTMTVILPIKRMDARSSNNAGQEKL